MHILIIFIVLFIIFRGAVYIPLFIIASLFIAICYYATFIYYVLGKRIGSLPGFLGGFCLALAILTQPIPWLRYFWWTAFIIDFTWIMFVYSLVIHWEDWIQKAPKDEENHFE